MRDFTIVIGAHAEFFTDLVRKELRDMLRDGGGSLEFADNKHFWNNGPADSLKIGYEYWKSTLTRTSADV